MKHLLQQMLQTLHLDSLIQYLKHLLHILAKAYIATYPFSLYLCFRQRDNRCELSKSLN